MLVRPVIKQTIFCLLICAITTSPSYAIVDPCGRQEAAVKRAENAVLITDRQVVYQTDRYLKISDVIDYKRASLAANVENARGLEDAAGSVAVGNGIGCAVSFFFSNGNCISGTIRGGVSRVSYAEARTRNAEAKYASYVRASEQQKIRQEARIEFAENRRNIAVDAYKLALGFLAECREGGTTVTSTTTVSGNTVTTTIGNNTSVGTVK